MSLQVGANTCFYVSTTPQWPFTTGSSTLNSGNASCYNLNLALAMVKTDTERTALWNMICKFVFVASMEVGGSQSG